MFRQVTFFFKTFSGTLIFFAEYNLRTADEYALMKLDDQIILMHIHEK